MAMEGNESVNNAPTSEVQQNQSSPRISSPPQDNEEKTTHLRYRTESKIRLVVPNSSCGGIIGKGGAIISTDNLLLCKMENEEDGQSQSTKKIIEIFSEFMMRITKFEELVSVGNKFLICFHQARGFLRRPPIEKTSSLVEQIIKAHDSRRVLSYFDAGCMNAHDCVQNVSKLRTCHLGLKGLINEAKSVVTELQALLDDAALAVQNAREKDEDASHYLDSLITLNAQEEVSPSSDLSKLEVIEYAGMMAAIYSMVQQDFTMQDGIVSSLSLKSQQGELETYCQMWSLRPYVDDDIMLKAWSLVW